jgi:hypothetical protein
MQINRTLIKHNDAERASEAAFASLDSISEDGGVVSLIRLATDGKLIDRTSCASLYHSQVGCVKGFLSQLYCNFQLMVSDLR